MRRLTFFLVLLLLTALACRKHPAPPRKAGAPPPPTPEVVQAARAAHPVIFVGLDGADWELLDDFMASGVMPNLAALAKGGRTGTLKTIQPPLSPLVWTTMMTGTSPLEHGILDFTRRDSETGALEPIPSSERKRPAIWNMANDGDKSVAVFGVWATWPAEAVKGLLVADRFASLSAGDPEPLAGTVYPPDQEAWARETLRQTEAAVGYDALHAYLPWLKPADFEKAAADPDPYAHPVSALRRILIETRAGHALATSWLGRAKPDLTVVDFQGTDILGHVFAPWAPPRQAAVTAADFERFSHVPPLYFAEIDRMLGEYRKLAEAHGAVLMIASDHGFRWKEGRPASPASAAAASAGRWHREEGIYLLWGPDIEAKANRGQGEVSQVCATLLALLGLPPGDGVAGPPLAGIDPVHAELADYRGHYQPAPAAKGDPQADAAEIATLRALGDLGAPEGTAAPSAAGSSRTAGSYNNEGLLHREHGETAAARAAYEKALAVDPKNAAAMWNLSDLLHDQHQDLDRSDQLLVAALAAGLPEGVDDAVGRTVAYARGGESERALKLLEQALAARPKEPRLHLLRGRYRLERHQCEKALDDFETATRYDPKNALAYASVGLARLCVGDGEGAAASFHRSLAIDPNQPEIRRALGQIG
ncbi:MAG TPA: alkaline phosphatase family protein [Thermoanaerobaculia bacterium]|nr:alkaline phosphatase family protein [Thermoanaerobaculia bacterium]